MSLTDDAATFHAALLADDNLIGRLTTLRGWTHAAITELGIGIDGPNVTIPVRNAAGAIVNLLRYAPNPARRGNGPKLRALPDHPRDLFPSPEMVEGDYLVIVEGEPDAITGTSLGLPCVAIPGVNHRPDAARFAGKTVLVLFDNDEPGNTAAAKWAKALCRVATVKRGTWPNDGDDLTTVWKRDPARFAATFVTVEDTAKPVGPPRLPIQSFGDFADSVGPRDETRNYLGALFRGGQRTHVIGPIGHGKTTFMAEATACAVHGRDFLGLRGRGGIRALYIDLEMPRELLLGTLKAARFDTGSPLFDVVSLPDGLEVDRNAEHREMIENSMEDYHIIVIDPWYKLIADELSEGMRNVRTVISFLDGLRVRNPRTAVVVGFHANEAQKGQKVGRLGDASGYKAFQRPADTAVVFERIKGNRSRLSWAKTRDPELPKMGEEWLLEWTRGEGFEKVERRRATDELYDHVTNEWQNVYDISDAAGMSRARASNLLNELLAYGRVDRQMIGKRAEWRRADAMQGKLAA
jgi:hypothetical protein